jgi:hypothetical protein
MIRQRDRVTLLYRPPMHMDIPLHTRRWIASLVFGCALALNACTGGKTGSNAASPDLGRNLDSGAAARTDKALNRMALT